MKTRRSKRGWTEGQKGTGRVGASPRGGGCVAPRVPERGTRPSGRSAERAGTRGAPGELGRRPGRKGSGRGQVTLRRRGDSRPALKVGEGIPRRAPAAGEINKAAHGRAGGHPLPAGAATAAAPSRPYRPLPRRRPPPGPSCRRPGPHGRAERGKFLGRPRPRAAAPRGPRAAHLAPPRAVARAGQLPLGQLGSARGCGCRGPRPPGAAHRPAPLRPPARPPRLRSRPPGRPALPLRHTALTYAAAATTRPGFPAREGSGGARQPASAGARRGTHPLAALPPLPPHRPPSPAPLPRRRARTPPARASPVTRARAPRPNTPPARARRTHPRPLVDSGRSISARATPRAHAHLNLTEW